MRYIAPVHRTSPVLVTALVIVTAGFVLAACAESDDEPDAKPDCWDSGSCEGEACLERTDCPGHERCEAWMCTFRDEGPDYSVWLTLREDDGGWSEPEQVIDAWPAGRIMVYYDRWIFLLDAPELQAQLNGDDPPPDGTDETFRPLFDFLTDEPAKVLEEDDGELVAYFSSPDLGGLGGEDIFSSRLVRGDWTSPENLGGPINTADDEVDLTFGDHGRLLYFTSNRPGGLGEEDIYLSRRDDDGVWGEPIHMAEANTPAIDFAYFIDAGMVFIGTDAEAPDVMDPDDWFNDIYVAPIGDDDIIVGPRRPMSDGVNAGMYTDLTFHSGDRFFFVSSRGREDL